MIKFVLKFQRIVKNSLKVKNCPSELKEKQFLIFFGCYSCYKYDI